MELKEFDPSTVEDTSLKKTSGGYRRAAKAKNVAALGFEQRPSNLYKISCTE